MNTKKQRKEEKRMTQKDRNKSTQTKKEKGNKWASEVRGEKRGEFYQFLKAGNTKFWK